MNGEDLVIVKFFIEETAESVSVYNFQVEDYHTYFVGECAVWVHNAECIVHARMVRLRLQIGKVIQKVDQSQMENLNFLKEKNIQKQENLLIVKMLRFIDKILN